MRLIILSVGRWHAGPERDLYEHFATRLTPLAKQLGLGTLELIEVRDAGKLLERTPKGACLIALDREGQPLTSEAFAAQLLRFRAQGHTAAAFLIGGAEGLPRTVLGRANLAISFGRLTFPHLLMRGLLAEQLYRAATILLDHPYHRRS